VVVTGVEMRVLEGNRGIEDGEEEDMNMGKANEDENDSKKEAGGETEVLRVCGL
jgi:hypothetical protein